MEGLSRDKMEWYIKNGKVGSQRNKVNKHRRWNTIKFSRKLWVYICNRTSETTDIKNLVPEINLNDIKHELDKTKKRRINNTKIKWLFFSEKGGDKVHYWGRRNESFIKSTKYPTKTGNMVSKVIERVKTACVLTSPSVLIPVYENERMSLGLHRDKFNGNPEYVINIYFGDERYLSVLSGDKTFKTKIICKQGMIRIFHPLFNDIFLHEKKPSEISRKIHYALSIRQGKIQHN